MSELVNHNRHGLAAALRRLADDAVLAAATVIDHDCNPYDETTALSRVLNRVESVKHARVLLDAARIGAARADTRRSA